MYLRTLKLFFRLYFFSTIRACEIHLLFIDMVANGMNADQIRKVFGVKNHPHSITIATEGPAEFILPSIERYRYPSFFYMYYKTKTLLLR